jgi:hypothetical protein
MLSQAIASRFAHEQGAAEERQRITSVMHDNIGVQLLGALHSRDPVRKDELIRDTPRRLARDHQQQRWRAADPGRT